MLIGFSNAKALNLLLDSFNITSNLAINSMIVVSCLILDAQQHLNSSYSPV
ncbi:3999_t:CDS:2 [Gigaspora margarita]|uniref:3999_t:CDS:1 n=1 Tax=Gigaspora margarita TaxID=4874 RepID=A0ABN7UBC5_GIGMA|nr:3999_t:CDS:2 [Gigaspora margarita]